MGCTPAGLPAAVRSSWARCSPTGTFTWASPHSRRSATVVRDAGLRGSVDEQHAAELGAGGAPLAPGPRTQAGSERVRYRGRTDPPYAGDRWRTRARHGVGYEHVPGLGQ